MPDDGPIEENGIIESTLFGGFGLVRSLFQGGKLLWGMWNDFKHIAYKGKTYARIGKRLYTQHAVDRMTPSNYGTAAGGSSGRSVAPEFVELAIKEGTSTPRIVGGVLRTTYTSGTLSVVTEENGKIIVTIITR